MTTLSIRNISRTTDLDRASMASVAGGTGKSAYPFAMAFFDVSKNSFSFDAKQSIDQSQNTLVNNGNNVAFASGITSTVKPTQTADNTINFG